MPYTPRCLFYHRCPHHQVPRTVMFGPSSNGQLTKWEVWKFIHRSHCSKCILYGASSQRWTFGKAMCVSFQQGDFRSFNVRRIISTGYIKSLFCWSCPLTAGENTGETTLDSAARTEVTSKNLGEECLLDARSQGGWLLKYRGICSNLGEDSVVIKFFKMGWIQERRQVSSDG